MNDFMLNNPQRGLSAESPRPQRGEPIFICVHLLGGESEELRFNLIEGTGPSMVEMADGPVTSKWMGICDQCLRTHSSYDKLIGGSVTWNDSAKLILATDEQPVSGKPDPQMVQSIKDDL